MKKVLIINGHPNRDSFCSSIADTYTKGAIKGAAKITRINLNELDFNLNLKFGYSKRMDLEPDLLAAIKKIKECEHMVWVFPIWWYGAPALLKGFIDRVFLPGIMFGKGEEKKIPEKLLIGKSARIIITSDTPDWIYRIYFKSPATNQFKKGILEFCGVTPVKTTHISSLKTSNLFWRKSWLYKIEALGENIK